MPLPVGMRVIWPHGFSAWSYKVYQTILQDQVQSVMQTLFPYNIPIDIIDGNAPIHTAKLIQEWFYEDQDEVKFLLWPNQSPGLNIIEPLWEIPEHEVDFLLLEEWSNFPPHTTVLHMYDSIPRRNEAVRREKVVLLLTKYLSPVRYLPLSYPPSHKVLPS